MKIKLQTRLRLIQILPPTTDGKRNRLFGLYQCECGNVVKIRVYSVKSGKTNSCGCWSRDSPNLLTHGLGKHPLHTTWASMKLRCYYAGCEAYKHYGAIGVRVCDEWNKDFKKFHDWALANGWRKGLYLDKDIKAIELGVKADLYSPERCQFVTRKINNKYTKQTRWFDFNGKKMTILDISEITGLPYSLLATRLCDSKMSVQKAISLPHCQRKVLFNGKMYSFKEISEMTGVRYNILKYRMNNLKMSLGEAITAKYNKFTNKWSF